MIKSSEKVDDLQTHTGLDIPIHVDAASGGFIAPFVYPKLRWSFDVSRVVSINTSGHKFGLVYPGLGWILWRDESLLHKDLIFELRESGFKHILILFDNTAFRLSWKHGIFIYSVTFFDVIDG